MTCNENIKKEIVHDCLVLGVTKLSDDIFTIDLKSEYISQNSTPGQFVNLDCNAFLRRPISICQTDKKNKTFQLGVKIIGKGTYNLSNLKEGDIVSVEGPLGNGFNLDGVKFCIVVGGGIGIFPLMFLLDEAKARGIKTLAVCGYRCVEDSFCTLEISQKADKVCFASECGRMEFDGNSVLALESFGDLDHGTVFTCGPAPMMKSLYEFCFKRNLKCYASLEERMGCGTGICLTCAVKIKSGDGYDYKRCCYDGPVFDAEDIIWE